MRAQSVRVNCTPFNFHTSDNVPDCTRYTQRTFASLEYRTRKIDFPPSPGTTTSHWQHFTKESYLGTRPQSHSNSELKLTSLRLHTTSSGEKLLKVSRYFSVVIDTTKKRNCSKTVVSHSQTHTKSGRLSCKFCKPVASFPGLPKVFEGLVPRLHGSRGLGSSPWSAQLSGNGIVGKGLVSTR